MGEKRIIPQPPCRRHAEGRILEELPDTLGLVLWQAVRHVHDWAGTPAAARGALFNPRPAAWVALKRAEARAFAPELTEALDRFAALPAAPLGTSAAQLADACRQVALWAEERGHRETALHFAEAAAVADPADPARANQAGRVTRGAGEFARAEVWFDRAIGLARRRGDHVQYTRAHIGYGILCQTLGRDARARRHFHTASVVAMKDGREWLAAEAQHDLMLMAAERGRYAEAGRHARKALAWYPKHHHRFPFFAADLAFLLVSERQHEPAARLLEGFLRTVRDPQRQVLGLSVLVRALAGAGRLKRFTRERRRLLRRLARHREYEAPARVNLAEAERAAGMWPQAEADARAALELARAGRDAVPERLARTLLRQVAARTPAPGAAPPREEVEALVATVSARLAGWSPTRRGRPPTLGRDAWAAA